MNALKLSLAAATATGLIVAGVSWSEPDDSRHRGPHHWGAHHRDSHPGQMEFPISIADAEAKAADLFARVDTNGNGEITSAEFAAAEMPKDHKQPWALGHFRHAAKRRAMHDHHDDAARGERRAEHEAAFFEALDTDGNGQLSAAEFDRDHQREVRKSLMKARIFQHLDTDANGVLNKGEFSPHSARLRELDVDDDGEVSRDELRDGVRARHHQAG